MELKQVPLSWAVLVSAVAVLAYYAARALHTVCWKPWRLERLLRRQGISGNTYRLLHGDLKEELQVIKEAWSSPMNLTHQIIPRVLPFPHQMVQRYGKTCFIWVGTTPRLIICDPALVKDVFLDKSRQFQKPPVNPLIKLLSKGLSSLEGEEWAKRRRIVSPAFHLDKLKGMVPAFLTSSVDMMKRWEGFVSSNGYCELDIWPELQNLTADVISRTAFGSSFEQGKQIFQLQKEQAVLVIEAARALYLPGFRCLPTAKNKRRMQVDREIKSILRGMINNKLNLMRMGEPVRDDLLGLMLQSSDLTEDEVIEECKLFYFAGQETTSAWLTWTLILLAMNPNWQHRAREEVFDRCGKNLPDFESINHLKIVTMVLFEVMRLYPPVITRFRQTTKCTKLGDMSLPSGVDILLPTILIHHDPQFWGDDVEEFNPNRFSEGISKATKGHSAFYPFGWGPRVCLGQSFAMIEAKMALALILQRFSFELSPSYAHAPYTVITLQPQYGAHLIIHKL